MKILILTRYKIDYNSFIYAISKWFSKENQVYLLTSEYDYFFSNGKIESKKSKYIYNLMNEVSNKLGIKRDLSYIGYMLRGIERGISFKPDVVFYIGLFSYFNPIISNLVARILNIPCVGDWIGSDLLLYRNILGEYFKRYFLNLNTLNLVQSEDMRDRAKKMTNCAKVYVSPDKGVDLDMFKSKHQMNIYDENKKSEKITKILYVGRLESIKGVDYLINAYRTVHENHPETILIIIGDGRSRYKLEKEIENTEIEASVKFKKYVEYENLPNYYMSSDIFVLPSLSEGLSNVLLEAMACGLPIIATDVGGNRELVIDKKGGYLVSPKDPSSISESIIKLIENEALRKDMGEYNKRYVKRYEQTKILEEKLQLIKKSVHGIKGKVNV